MLFIHGGPGATGTVFAPLAARLPDLRCLLLDRPGTGVSRPQRLPDAAAVRRQAETLAASVRAPTYVLWGSEEVYGDEAVARSLVEAMPSAELELLPGAGHLCWFDDPDHAADVTRRHLEIRAPD